VPGWGGDDRRVTPPIKPGETFIAEMTPPHAGTFMYHTHWHDDVQLTSGMYGPLIVTEPEKPYDPATERMVVLSARPLAPDVADALLINGSAKPASLQMQVGTTYRIRMINITPNAVNYSVLLTSGGQPIEWRCIAKDGFELPATQSMTTRELLSLAVGETRDFEFRPETPGELQIEVHLPERLRASLGIEVH
jgi:FtsP/CotA-like multicopper oxidase with cupredoxin domain